MKNKNIFYIFMLGLLLTMITNGCNKDYYKNIDPGKSSTYPLNGEYWVQLDAATITGTDTTWAVDPFGIGYGKIIISNLATNKGDSIWLDDLKNLWQVKVKVACNPALRTFHVTNGLEYYNDDATTITNGKLLLNKGITKTGNKTDSIFMLVQWASDPTTLYRMSGVRRTGFQADDY
jgi:hypothetical protein